MLRGNDLHAAIHGRVHTYDANTGTLQRTRTLLPCRVHGLACNEDGALLAWGVDAVGVARGDAVTTIATETRCVAAAFASSEEVATLTSAGAVERRDAATLARRGATAALRTSGELRCGALRVAAKDVAKVVPVALREVRLGELGHERERAEHAREPRELRRRRGTGGLLELPELAAERAAPRVARHDRRADTHSA